MELEDKLTRDMRHVLPARALAASRIPYERALKVPTAVLQDIAQQIPSAHWQEKACVPLRKRD